jgi:hypothetical protein
MGEIIIMIIYYKGAHKVYAIALNAYFHRIPLRHYG